MEEFYRNFINFLSSIYENLISYIQITLSLENPEINYFLSPLLLLVLISPIILLIFIFAKIFIKISDEIYLYGYASLFVFLILVFTYLNSYFLITPIAGTGSMLPNLHGGYYILRNKCHLVL